MLNTFVTFLSDEPIQCVCEAHDGDGDRRATVIRINGEHDKIALALPRKAAAALYAAMREAALRGDFGAVSWTDAPIIGDGRAEGGAH